MPRAPWWILAFAPLTLASRDAGAICREVTEIGSPPPAIQADQEILVIKRSGVAVGCGPPADGGPTPTRDAAPGDGGGPVFDGGAAGDASTGDASTGDASTGDAGIGDAGIGDAGPADGGACQSRLGDTVTWVVQPRFSTGPDGARFALLLVTPRAPLIETAPASTFEDLARATAPLANVEERTIEDESLGYQCNDPKFGGAGGGAGCASVDTSDDGWSVPDPSGGVAADAGTIDDYVRVTTVGSYQVVVLSATDADELAVWLDGAGYAHQPSDIDALRPYLELGWTVSAVRVTSEAALDTSGLEPLSFTFEGTDMRLPLGVARQPVGARALLKVYYAAEGRYQLPDASVAYAGWTRDGAFLTANVLDADLSGPADEDPVAYRAAADTPLQRTYTVIKEVRIPSSECPGGADSDLDLCGCRTTGTPGSTAGTLLLAAGCAVVVLRRRRPRRPRA